MLESQCVDQALTIVAVAAAAGQRLRYPRALAQDQAGWWSRTVPAIPICACFVMKRQMTCWLSTMNTERNDGIRTRVWLNANLGALVF